MMIMSHVVEIGIEGKRYIPLLSLEKNAAGTLDLTTISSRQSRAIIKVFLRNDNRRLLREIEVSNIPADRAGVPLIRLQALLAGRNLLVFKVEVNGRLQSRINIRLKNHSRRRNKGLFIIMLLLLGAGILFSSWLWLGKRNGKKQPVGGKVADSVERVANIEPPAAIIEPPAVSGGQAGGKPAGSTELERSTELILPEDTIYFLPDSSSLTPAAEAKLRTLLSLLLENPELEIEFYGYCAPMGSEEGRVNLSFERARRVHDFLTASGWKPDITAKLNGAGSSKEVTNSPEMQHLNRRVEILISSAAD